MSEELRLYDGGLGREIEDQFKKRLSEAEQRGYRRGVQDAAKVAKTHGVYPHLNVYAGGPEWYQHGQKIAAAILSLLEQTSDSNRPYPGNGAGRSAKRE